MSKSSAMVGFGMALAVIWLGVVSHAGNPWIFFDSHALIMVVGGTIAAGLIAFPPHRFKDLAQFLVLGVLYPGAVVRKRVVDELLRMAGVIQCGLSPTELHFAAHPFLAEGYHLIRKSNFTTDELRAVLTQRSHFFRERYQSDTRMLMALGKFPPAFGLLGATSGMIAMMANLSTGGEDTIGPSMALALVATFWGISIANFIILPLADNARRIAETQAQLRSMMITGLVLVHQNSSIEYIYESMKGFLSLEDREDPDLLRLKRFLTEKDFETVVTDLSKIKKAGG